MTAYEKAQVIKLRDAGAGYGKIAKTLNIPLNTVKSFCRRNAANGEQKNNDTPEFTGEQTQCENCGVEIHQVAKRKKKRFCCDRCRNQWWNSHLDQVKRKKVYTLRCPHCGSDFQLYGDARRKYCSHACYIADRFGGGSRV